MSFSSAAVRSRGPAHIDLSPPMSGEYHGNVGGGSGVCGGVVGNCYDGSGSCCGGPGRHLSNDPRSSTHLMLQDHLHLHHHHQVPQTMATETVEISPSVAASTYPLPGILSASANNVSPQPYQAYYDHQKNTRSGAVINDVIDTPAVDGEMPYFALNDERAAVSSTASGTIGAGLETSISSKRYKGCREIRSDATGSSRNDAPSSTAAKYYQGRGFGTQDLGQTSLLFTSSPSRIHHATITTPSHDAATLAVGSRPPVSLGAGTGTPSLSGMTPTFAAASTPPFSPFISGISGEGMGLGGGDAGVGAGGSKGLIPSSFRLEGPQQSPGLFSLQQRSTADRRAGAGFPVFGMGYGRNDSSNRVSELSKPPAPFTLGGSSSDRSTGNERALTPAEKLERARIRNRDHSRKSRQRKKALVEGMKKQVSELGAYRVLVEQAYDLISAHSMDDRALFLFASEAFQRLLGINPQELIGAQFLHVVHQDDAIKVADAVRSALLYKEVVQVRYRLRHHSRGEFMVETSFRTVPTRLLAVTRVNAPSPSAEGGQR